MIFRALNLARMLRNERRNQNRIRQLQNEAFLKLFRHAYGNVPFYRDLYSDHGISIADIRGIEDIDQLPVVHKEHLRSAAASGRLWGKTDSYYGIETSGSSGIPFRFYVNPHDNQWRKAQYLLPYVSTGRKPWDLVLRLTADSPSLVSRIPRLASFRDIRVHADAPAADQYSALTALTPTILQGYPSALRSLAMHIRSSNLRVPRLKVVYSDSEILLPETRAVLQEVFNTDVLDVFGSYETDNIAYECALHRGHHIAEDSVIVETLTDAGSVTNDGSGELICTVFHNFVTPFIRYNLGDRVETMPGLCACGRTSRRLSVIQGRANDSIAFPDGSERNALVLIRLLVSEFSDLVNEFQIRQIDPDRFDLLLVENRPLHRGDIARFRKLFARELPFAKTDLRLVDRIERTAAGKYKAFVGLDSLNRDTQ